MILFDGYAFAHSRETALKERVENLLLKDKKVTIAAILFEEDNGSRLYTQLKKEAAERVGIGYQVHQFSMSDDVAAVQATLKQLNADPAITGIIVQKPSQATWLAVCQQSDKALFVAWWQSLVTHIDQAKDVDGLTPTTLQAVQDGTWREKHFVLPATAKAVISILDHRRILSSTRKAVVIGKSDIFGKPLFYELQHCGIATENIGSKELKEKIDQKKYLHEFNLVITATGHAGLIIGKLLFPGTVVIDVGEPQPDVDRASVAPKVSFLTPVPGGVGPVTVVSLLENAVNLVEYLGV